MSKTSATRRACKGDLNLYSADTTLGWRVVGHTSAHGATAKLARGDWREVYDEQGHHLGYQVLVGKRCKCSFSPHSSSSSVSARESELNAGLRGASRTAGLTEEQRLNRHNQYGKSLPPEDAIERAMEKVRLWPYPASRVDDGSGEAVFGDRAVRVYPKTQSMGGA